MFKLALSGLEKIINTYLRLDSDSFQRLSYLENKIIKIQIIDWNIEFFILFTKKGLQLMAFSKKEANTIIYGTLFNLFKASCIKGSSSVLFKNKVEIDGDIYAGEQIWDILTSIDIDWEEQLSKIIGDILAHQVGIHVRRFVNFRQFALKTFRMNLQDYLQNESQVMPSSEEIESLIQSITDLQYSIDRAEARIQCLLLTQKD